MPTFSLNGAKRNVFFGQEVCGCGNPSNAPNLQVEGREAVEGLGLSKLFFAGELQDTAMGLELGRPHRRAEHTGRGPRKGVPG